MPKSKKTQSPLSLLRQMELVMDFIEAAILIDKKVNEPTDHYEICTTTANQYSLWQGDNTFPVWLSRIVEGAIQDHNPEAQP